MKYFIFSLFTLNFFWTTNLSAQIQKPKAPHDLKISTINLENVKLQRGKQHAVPPAEPSIFTKQKFDLQHFLLLPNQWEGKRTCK